MGSTQTIIKSSLFLAVGFVLSFATHSFAQNPGEYSCPPHEMYEVHYIDLNTEFFVPPIPLEGHAQKVFAMCSSRAALLIKAADGQNQGAEPDLGRLRIKIVGRDGALTIDQQKNVFFNNANVDVPSEGIDSLMFELRELADMTPDRRD